MSIQGTTSDSSSRPSLGGTGYTQGGRVSVAPTRTPPRYDDIPRATVHKRAEALLAPVFNGVPNSEHVYFHSEDYPFAAEQFDRLKEERLVSLKKNQNAPRPSEHPPVRGKKCQNVSYCIDINVEFGSCSLTRGLMRDERSTLLERSSS